MKKSLLSTFDSIENKVIEICEKFVHDYQDAHPVKYFVL